tara:strand:- start:7291 stop:7659 length:369 start_codon:yes stop_codon:yes gene_type:complete
MELFKDATDENLVVYAAKHYYNPRAVDIDDFYSDLKKFKYIKRQINRYQEDGKLSERLILNHLIVVFNMFGQDATMRILELKMAPNQWGILKAFLLYLGYIKETDLVGVSLDQTVVDVLRRT